MRDHLREKGKALPEDKSEEEEQSRSPLEEEEKEFVTQI